CCALLALLVSLPAARAAGKQPNIVFILADDFSMNLLQYMDDAPTGGDKGMKADGGDFSPPLVSHLLFFPSRPSIFTGQYPHNTHVFTNNWAPEKGKTDGGFGAFMANVDENHTFVLGLHNLGSYTTAMLGKYLNGYEPNKPTPFLNWGWDGWYVAGNG